MKEVKAWAVFDEKGKIIDYAISIRNKKQAYENLVYMTSMEKYTPKILKEMGYTVKPITITWEEE